MKKNTFIKTSLFLIVFAASIYVNSKTVFADSYPMTCSLFEVSKINDNGSLSKVECFDSFSKAQNKMKENDDYVVRNAKSLSPTKIVDMNAGIVYTYPYRANSLTQSVYSQLNSSLNGAGASTYLTIHYPMEYLGNRYYYETKSGYSAGWVHVNCHGFDGFADLEYVDFVPYKYIEKGIPIILGGNDKTSRNEQPFKVVCKANTYEASKNGKYTDLLFTFYRGWSSNTNGGEGLKASSSIGVAPDFMVPGTKYYSNDGVNFYSDIRLKKFVGTYYNYYQFLPFRTKSNISGATLDSYLKASKPSNYKSSQLYNKGNDFKNNESLYGCNAVLTYAMAVHESGWGTSTLSYSPYNNLFGYGAYDSNVSLAHKYPSISDCIASQMGDNLANYMDVKSGTYFSMSLGTKGGGFMTKYASDPYWAEKISHYYYDIDKFANNNNGNLSDYNTYSLALVNSYNIDVKKDAKSSSSTYYKTANKNGYQNNLITVTLGQKDGYTKVQLSNPLDKSGNVVYPITIMELGTVVPYDFDKCVGYVPTSALVPLNYSSEPIPPQPKEPVPSKMEPVVVIDSLTLQDNTISIKGLGAITYSNFDDLSKIKHEFVIKNIETGNEATFDLTTEEYAGFGLNDGYDYKYVGFTGNIDLTQIIDGSFKLMIRITNGEYVKDKEIRNNSFVYYNMMSKQGNITNRISSNSRYNYRLELEISSTPLDYSKVNIVDNRPSLFSYDSFTIDEELNIHIDGQAFIYYTNYDDPEKVNYKVYLIKNDTEYKELATSRTTCPLDFNKVSNSSYDLTNICFETNDNISDLQEGKYKMIIEINKEDGTKTYVDYVEMTNLGNLSMPSVQKEDKTYEVIKSTVRERMELEVKANEQ